MSLSPLLTFLLINVSGVVNVQQYSNRTSVLLDINRNDPYGFMVAIPLSGEFSYEITPSIIPEGTIKVGKPAILRDLRVVPVSVNPPSHPVKTQITLNFYYTSSDFPSTYTPSFRGLYEHTVVNFKYLGIKPKEYPVDDLNGARYLIIVPDMFAEYVEPLAEWKTQKGMLAYVAPLSETGPSSSQIKNFIQNAYNTWDIPPEFVLLVGNASNIPFPNTDNYYVTVAGNDPLIDIFVGRFPAANSSQVATMVSKTIGYEIADSFLPDTSWIRKATIIVRNDYDQDDSIYYADAQYATSYMEREGYTQIDLFDRIGGYNASHVVNAVNEGRSIVMYRGQGVGNWWAPFNVNPYTLNNVWKLPIVVSTTCATIDPYGGSYAGEQWMQVGTPSEPKGSVGFFGTTTVRSHVAHLRSAVAQGFFYGLFDVYVESYGEACEIGRLNLYNTYYDLTDYNGFTTLGDPELPIRTKTPISLTIIHPETIPSGPETLQIFVQDQSGLPIKDALVGVSSDSALLAFGYTNVGDLTLYLDVPPGEFLTITASKRNYIPETDTIFIVTQGPYPGEISYQVNDSNGGNDDGLLNPNENFSLDLTVTNVGSSTAHNLIGIIRSDNPLLTITDSVIEIGDLPPSNTVTLPNSFSMHLSSNAVAYQQIPLNIEFIADEGQWNFPLTSLVVYAPVLQILGVVIDDDIPGGNSNGRLDPDESAFIYPIILNSGNYDIGLTFLHLSQDEAYAATDPVSYFSYLNTEDQDTINDPFALHISPGVLPGTAIQMHLYINGDASTYSYIDTTLLTLTVGEPVGPDYPVGPDSYGYYIYDDTDTLSGNAPVFEWIEIAPPQGPGELIPAITNADADTVTLQLPFTFKFYGQTFVKIGAASNGFLELGGSTYRFGDNGPIPQAGGPHSLIAPFWDDLDPSEGGDIYQYYDQQNHRWIIEYKDVQHFNGGSPETFQVILLDPQYYPTPTQDGEIIIQYQNVSNISSATVGIESPSETIGLQYVYNNNYAQGAATIISGRSLRITTVPPQVTQTNFWVHSIGRYVLKDSLWGNGNNIPDPAETVQVWIPLTNSGDSVAEGVNLILTSENPYVTIIDTSAYYGDIAPGDTAIPQGQGMGIYIHPDVADTSVILNLYIYAEGIGEPWVEYMSLGLYVLKTGETTSLIPRILKIGPVYPNPARVSPKLHLELPKSGQVKLALYDITGRRIRWYSRTLSAGIHNLQLPGNWATLPSGLYILRVKVNKKSFASKLLIQR